LSDVSPRSVTRTVPPGPVPAEDIDIPATLPLSPVTQLLDMDLVSSSPETFETA